MTQVTTFRTMLLLLVVALASCGRDLHAIGSTSRTSLPKPPEYVVFHDRLDPKYEWVIVIGPDQTFIQKAVFPGFTDRKWYVLDEKHLDDAISRQPGELSPPFVPGGPNLIRSEVIDDKNGTTHEAYFKNENLTLRQALENLEIAAEATKPLATLPKWVSERMVATRWLGL